ncbi:hypothetical protein ND861_00435 [Leptospira sp. 2 VSF19]|uniref:Lipoprotein n=1 Tax=Leptospira soteropolitanensis TaxID=2950025 RepID=A0AAW5V725_9LEPT|nr:hypothetical protein [Leptospira soteropolitanensis]MCW7491108.1 hypothetical protein [Leptospira soteropolitanensis]MCW7498692.1 hypothetical protein [Leptospira soteropolitanensis]MCW7521715.1 hypothetical protein [Leptospira soteropolitanensis]MCW7524796.1 hypothetical protein [Leptospira soteropolitanensis]MCW7528663.1 hypothetical protein [Leptospira soteropolitanensis]
MNRFNGNIALIGNVMFYRFFFLNILILLFSCKLNLNNPNDPNTKDYWIRALIQDYLLNDGCRNFAEWNRRYGESTSSTYGADFLFLSNGDIILIGITKNPIQPGVTSGITGSFEGTPGAAKNLFLMRIARNNGDIQWIDYLGQVYSSPNNLKLHQFSNGELAVSFIALGSGQSGSALISPKSSSAVDKSVYLGRHRTDGSRVWFTYLDSSSIGANLVTALDKSDRFHLFAENDGNTGHISFSELPSSQNVSLGGESDTDILYGLVDSNGNGVFQRYITSSYNESPSNAVYSNGYLYLAGISSGNLEGTSHPYLGGALPFIAKFNASTGNREMFIYTGYPSASFDYSRQLVVSDTSILQLLRTNLPWSSVVREPMQSDTEHYAFAQYDLNGGLQWVSFLGFSSGDVATLEEPPTLFESNGLLRNRSRIPASLGRYTSGISVSSGTGSGDYQLADVWIRANSGYFERIRYSSNISGTENKRTDQMKTLCDGKYGYMDRVFFSESEEPTQIEFQTAQE